MSKDNLRFPSGKTVKKLKQQAKKIKKNFPSHTDALNHLASANGLSMPWDKALTHLEEYWSGWFAVDIYQEDYNWQIDVRHRRFESKKDAEAFGKTFAGSLKWVGGPKPLVHINDRTQEVTPLNNSDIRVWKLKSESEGKISVSMHDMERVHCSIDQFPEVFGNASPTFCSLAYGAEYGDGDGLPKEDSSVPSEDDLIAMANIEMMGIKIRAEQSGCNIFQIGNTYAGDNINYYLLTKSERHEIESIIATIFELTEDYNYLPSYYSGGISMSGQFIATALKDIFNQVIITSENFNFAKGSNVATSIDVSVINIFDIEDAFDSKDYDLQTFRDFLLKNKEKIQALYRLSIGLPENIDESKWKIVNINPNAIDRIDIPTEVENLQINKAWCLRHELEERIFHALGKDMELSRDDDFSVIYDIYKSDESGHDYPIYKIKHEEFEFKAS